MQKQCCVPGCGKLMKPLCRLPADETHQREWLKVIGDPSLKTKCCRAIYWYYRICRKHFTDEAFHNLKYTMKRLRNLNRILNDTPTLHLPVITNEDISDMINLDNSKPTSPKQIELLVQKEAEQSNHFIDIPTSPYNSNSHLYTTPLKTGAEPRTYCRKVKVEPEGNLENKELLKSHAEIEISNRTETFACSGIKEESLEAETELHKIDEENVCIDDMFGENASLELQNYDYRIQVVGNEIKKERSDLESKEESIDIKIKEESIDLDAETELHKIDEENVGIEFDIFSENAPLKLPSYDHKTQAVVNKIKEERTDLEIKEDSIDLETEKELHKIDKESVESDLFSQYVSLKLQSFNRKTRTVVKNLIDTILFNAENGMYDPALTPTSSSLQNIVND